MERPAASANAHGPELFGSNGSTKHTPEISDDQAIWRDYTVVYRQPRTAVYWNSYDHVAIRQEPIDQDEDDVVITIDPKHIPALIARLEEMLEEVTP